MSAPQRDPLEGYSFRTVSADGELAVIIKAPGDAGRISRDVYRRDELKQAAQHGSEKAELALRMLRLIEEAQATNQKGQPSAD